jgi:hypothetical protein
MRAVPAFGLLLTLGACATDGIHGSYVALSSDSDASVVAGDIAAFAADQMPAGTARIAVYPAGPDDTLAPKLLAALQAQGLVTEAGKNATAPSVHQLRYQVEPLDQGELVRLELDGRTAAQLLIRGSAGSLEPSGPFTVREFASK